MDPVTLAAITGATSVLAAEALKGACSEAGKDVWAKIKSLFGWKKDPPLEELSKRIAEALHSNDAVADQVVQLLQSQQTGSASTMAHSFKAKNVIVANSINSLKVS